MNEFDMRRVENAIWTLAQYDWEIREILKEEGSSWDGENLFKHLRTVKEYIKDKLEVY